MTRAFATPPGRGFLIAVAAAFFAGCASLPDPTPSDVAFYDEDDAPLVTEAAPSIDAPPIEPIEPVEPPMIAPPLLPAPQSAGGSGETSPAHAPDSAVVHPPSAPPSGNVFGAAAPASLPANAPATVPPPTPIPPEDLAALALISDLVRYNAFGPDDVRREVGVVTNALARDRSDANRVRLAVLYTLSHGNPQDDQRALQLLENVAKSGGGQTPVKAIAAILHVQVSARVRSVRDEQARGNEAVQKLEALRAMERSLLRDRVRSGGGGGGGGGGSGN